MTRAILLALALSTCSCGVFVDKNKVMEAVANAGYSDAQIVESSRLFPGFSGCGESDAAAFLIEATNAKGERIKFTACAGFLFKGVTLRF
jgi:hypothetical protein